MGFTSSVQEKFQLLDELVWWKRGQGRRVRAGCLLWKQPRIHSLRIAGDESSENSSAEVRKIERKGVALKKAGKTDEAAVLDDFMARWVDESLPVVKFLHMETLE